MPSDLQQTLTKPLSFEMLARAFVIAPSLLPWSVLEEPTGITVVGNASSFAHLLDQLRVRGNTGDLFELHDDAAREFEFGFESSSVEGAGENLSVLQVQKLAFATMGEEAEDVLRFVSTPVDSVAPTVAVFIDVLCAELLKRAAGEARIDGRWLALHHDVACRRALRKTIGRSKPLGSDDLEFKVLDRVDDRWLDQLSTPCDVSDIIRPLHLMRRHPHLIADEDAFSAA